jgi:hypothetical protein
MEEARSAATVPATWHHAQECPEQPRTAWGYSANCRNATQVGLLQKTLEGPCLETLVHEWIDTETSDTRVGARRLSYTPRKDKTDSVHLSTGTLA